MKTRKIKITTKIFIYIYAVVILANSLLGGVIYVRTANNTIDQISLSARDLAVSAAESINPTDFNDAKENGETSEGFKNVFNALDAFLNADQLMYVYSFMKGDDGKTYFVVDTDDEGASYMSEYEADELMEKAFEGEAIADTESSSDEWGTYLSAYAPIKDGDTVVGIVGVDVDYSTVEASLMELRIFLISVSLGIYIILLVAIGLICRKLRNGFNVLNNKVIELSGSDGDLSKNIEINTGDEFETIAGNFNKFINQVYDLTCTVNSASQLNVNTVDEMNQDITTLSANMEQCSATSESVSDNMETVTEQANELAEQIGKTNSFVLEKSQKASKEAEYAAKQKEAAKKLITELNAQIQDAIIQAKSIEKVEDVVNEITDISMQTRILSLNARVEASRAGDAGKGFAVVATEIGDLSDKTDAAVLGIDEINNTVQRAMAMLNESVTKLNEFMMSSVLSDYEGYANLGTEFGESTVAISHQMQELNENSAIISEKISQANLSVADISSAISDSAHQLEMVSLSSDSILNSMQELLDKSFGTGEAD